MHDGFSTSLIDSDIQKKNSLKNGRTKTSLLLVINMELGMQKQHQIQQHNKTLIPASVNAVHYPANLRSSSWSLSNIFHKQGIRSPVY